MRTFEGGATRDGADNKNNYAGFLSPLVIRRFGDFMRVHQTQKDGKLRSADNWKSGMGTRTFLESNFRHFVDLWTIDEGYAAIDFDGNEVDLEEALCASMFNTMGYLHEVLEAKLASEADDEYETILETDECDLPGCSCHDLAGSSQLSTGPCEYESCEF
jgi:hypothetical protein